MDTRKLNIPETLESIRMEKHLNKGDFATLCGISNSFYSEIIGKKKSINLETLEKICANINVPIEVFIFKAINEDAIEDVNRRKLVREIRPLMKKIADYLYYTDDNTNTSKDIPGGDSDLLKARHESLDKFLEKH